MALFFGAVLLALLAGAHAEIPGCKIRITSEALELGKDRRQGGGWGGSPLAKGAARSSEPRCGLSEAGGAALSGARAGDHHHPGPERERGPILLQHLRVSGSRGRSFGVWGGTGCLEGGASGLGRGLAAWGGASGSGAGLEGWDWTWNSLTGRQNVVGAVARSLRRDLGGWKEPKGERPSPPA